MLRALGALAFAEAGVSVRRSLLIHGLYLLAALTVMAGIGFGLAALHVVLTARYDAVMASLVIAFGLMVVAMLVFAVAAFLQSRPRRPNAMAETALAVAPVAITAVMSKPGIKVAALGGVMLLAAMIGRELRR